MWSAEREQGDGARVPAGAVVIEEKGVVVGVKPGRALVETVRSGSCASCGSDRACACSGGERGRRVWAEDALGVVPGDRVVLAVSADTVLRAGVFVYVLPAAALLVGAAAGNALAPTLGVSPDLGAAGLGFFGLAAAMLVSRFLGGVSARGPRIVGRG